MCATNVKDGLPDAVLLDLDDTILDDSGHAARCWVEACAAHASELDGLDPTVLLEAIERVRTWYWSDAERHRMGRLDLLEVPSLPRFPLEPAGRTGRCRLPTGKSSIRVYPYAVNGP